MESEKGMLTFFERKIYCLANFYGRRLIGKQFQQRDRQFKGKVEMMKQSEARHASVTIKKHKLFVSTDKLLRCCLN